MRFTLSGKLILGFTCILLMLVGFGLLSISEMKTLNQKTVEVQSKWLPAVKAINEINYLIEHVAATDLKHVVSNDMGAKGAYEEEINKTVGELNNTFKEYESMISSEEEATIFKNMRREWDWYIKIHDLVIQASNKRDNVYAGTLVGGANDRFNTIRVYLDKLVKINMDGAIAASNEGSALFETSRRNTIAISAVAVILGLIIAIFISNKISRPVKKMALLATEIAEGNLRVEQMNVKNKDEIGDLANAFNVMSNGLRTVVQQVATNTEQVAASAEELLASSEQTSRATEQIASTIQEVASGTEQQAQSVQESSKAVTEMSIGAEQIASNAQTVSTAAVQASTLSQEGNQTIQVAIKQINSIHKTISGLAEVIKGLGNRSQEIGQIVEVISGIAGQTNLLALNAAIEAARAGEQGRGFAVVADEVRKLAEQSSSSAQQISDLIQGIQVETQKAVSAMSVGTREVAEGLQMVNSAGDAFEQIQQSIVQVARQIQEVSAAAEQMSANTEHVVNSIQHIAQIAEEAASGTQTVSASTEEQLASMEEISSSANALSNMAEELQMLVGKFKL